MDEPRAAPPYPASVAANKYNRLQSRSLIGWLVRLFSHKTDETLLPFEPVQQVLRNRIEVDRGTQMIPIGSIVGSVGRYRDFTRAFLPLEGADAQRWQRLDVALNELRSLPPIDVYKIGNAYFVRDGNHRVSVAKANGLTHIEAHVTEIPARVPFSPGMDVDGYIIQVERAAFLDKTHLDKTRPGLQLEITEPGRYQDLLQHIGVHRYFMGLELKRDVSLEEAAVSWYDHVYLPVIESIRNSGVLKEFPRRTEADLYLWVAYHRERLKERYGTPPEPEAVASDLAEHFSERPVARLAKTVIRAVNATRRAATESPQPPDHEDEHL